MLGVLFDRATVPLNLETPVDDVPGTASIYVDKSVDRTLLRAPRELTHVVASTIHPNQEKQAGISVPLVTAEAPCFESLDSLSKKGRPLARFMGCCPALTHPSRQQVFSPGSPRLQILDWVGTGSAGRQRLWGMAFPRYTNQ